MLFFARLAGGMYPVDWHGYITPSKIVSALREHFMPWRNNLLYKIDQQERERKAKEDAKIPVVTFEEWKRMKQEADRDEMLLTHPILDANCMSDEDFENMVNSPVLDYSGRIKGYKTEIRRKKK